MSIFVKCQNFLKPKYEYKSCINTYIVVFKYHFISFSAHLPVMSSDLMELLSESLCHNSSPQYSQVLSVSLSSTCSLGKTSAALHHRLKISYFLEQVPQVFKVKCLPSRGSLSNGKSRQLLSKKINSQQCN